MRYQPAPQRYESSPGSKHVIHEQDALSPEPFGMELQIGGAVSVPVRALVLRPVISDGYRPYPSATPMSAESLRQNASYRVRCFSRVDAGTGTSTARCLFS